MKKYLSKLNWGGFVFMMCLMALAALLNDGCTSFIAWLILWSIVGIPLSLVVLILGKDF